MSEIATPSPNRSAVFGVFAVLIAAATAGGAWWVVNSYQDALEAAKRPTESREVLAAAHDLVQGDVLADSDFIHVRVPLTAGEPAAFYTDPDDLLGVQISERILAGEPIRRERLDDGLALDDTTLEPGTRAVTLRVDRAAGVGGMVMPGAYVDVIVTIRPDANAEEAKWVTETIIQAVRVLAVGDASTGAVHATTGAKGAQGKNADKVPSREVYATLEVEPEEAEKIAMATTRGDVYLSLRPRNDFDLVETDAPLVTNALVGIDPRPSAARTERVARRRAQAAAPPAQPVGVQAEVISGKSMTIERFGPGGERVLEPKKGK